MKKKREEKTFKYIIRAWSNLPCPYFTEKDDAIQCNDFCDDNADTHPCKDVRYVRTNNKCIYLIRLFLCLCLYDYLETISPESEK